MCKEQRERELNLHSTMFLLILDALKAQSKTEIAFTFHNVSINSVFQMVAELYLEVIYIPQCFY